jgi:hypothetical protein
MTLDQWSQLVTAIAAAIAAILGAVNRNHMLNQDVQLRQNSNKIEEIHLATNSMKDELVAAVKSEATAAGIATGKAQQKASDISNR